MDIDGKVILDKMKIDYLKCSKDCYELLNKLDLDLQLSFLTILYSSMSASLGMIEEEVKKKCVKKM